MRSASWAGAGVAALVVMLAPRWIAAAVLFAVIAAAAAWVTWSCLADARPALDDRADLVAHEPRRLPSLPRLPPPPVLPRLRRPPPAVLPPGAVVVPGAIRGWLRPPEKD